MLVVRADGGGSANRFLMQFQADMLGVPVEVPEVTETTALGAAYLAGLAVGFWDNQQDLSAQWRLGVRYEPQMSRDEALEKLKKPAYDEEQVRHEFDYVASKLGISNVELKSYLTGPNRSHEDYRSQLLIYNLGAKMMRILGLERGGKR